MREWGILEGMRGEDCGVYGGLCGDVSFVLSISQPR